MGEKWNAYRLLVGKLGGKRWEDNIVPCRPVAKQWLHKQLPQLGNDRGINKYTTAVVE
jgi:hypothetical protein